MKRFLICLCLVVFFLTGCGGEGETSSSGELSPGLDYLRKDAVLYRHTAYQEDLSFTSGANDIVIPYYGTRTWNVGYGIWTLGRNCCK